MPEEFDDSVMNQTILTTGSDVGDLAMRLFGEYTEVPYSKNHSEMIPATQKLIDKGIENICEAIASSSLPTVDTKYPLAHIYCPLKYFPRP